MVTLRERNHAIELVPFHPMLKFARLIAGVSAALEHRDHHHLHRYGPLSGSDTTYRQRSHHPREHCPTHAGIVADCRNRGKGPGLIRSDWIMLAGMFNPRPCILFAFLGAASLMAADGPVLRADHVVVSVSSIEDAQRLHRVFTEELGLPAAWPVQKWGTRVGGGVFLGNFNLELAVWPQVDPYQLLGLALEVRDTDAAYAELRARGLRIKEQDPQTGSAADGRTIELWRNATITELAGEGLGIFLCKYNPAWLAPYAEAARKSFAGSGGGPAGVIGVASIEITIPASRRDALQKLVSPAQPESWTPPVVIVDGPRYQIHSVKVKCRDPERTKGLLPAGLPILFTRSEPGN